jgi:hypothetical protein
MRTTCLALAPAFACLLCATASAHGGQYRGPGNVVAQPAASTNRGNSAAKSTPSSSTGAVTTGGTASSSSGAAAGSLGPGAAGSRGVTPRGAQLDEDLGRWEFWWEFGKDPFLRLREAVHGGSRAEDQLLDRRLGSARIAAQRPTSADLQAVASLLEQRLVAAADRDTASACMIALAKIGGGAAQTPLLPKVAAHLRGKDQELRETAALALGIHGVDDEATIETLVGLVEDGPAGRRASGDVAVNERTRAFAAYALGLLRVRSTDGKRIARMDLPLHAILAQPGAHSRDLKVAAIEALGLLPSGDADVRLAVERAVVALGDYYKADLGPGELLLQAHVPPAIARLLRGSPRGGAAWLERFAADLRASLDGAAEPARASSVYVAQSCAMALGDLSAPWEDGLAAEAVTAQLLLDCYRNHKDRQTRSFAISALARMGGDEARSALRKELATAGRAIERPWVAMALGVWTARRIAAAREAGESLDDAEVREALTALKSSFDDAQNPNVVGALGIAIGLAGDAELDGPALRKALQDRRNQDDAAGYLALALGLLRDRSAVGDVRDLLQQSGRRPFVMLQCSRALGLIGDQEVTRMLCDELQAADAGLFRLAAAAAAIGQLGDRRSLEPLIALLRDDDKANLTRAFAAVALGSVCDKEPLPWNSAYATQTNYRAAVDTLTDGARGILDIL